MYFLPIGAQVDHLKVAVCENGMCVHVDATYWFDSEDLDVRVRFGKETSVVLLTMPAFIVPTALFLA